MSKRSFESIDPVLTRKADRLIAELVPPDIRKMVETRNKLPELTSKRIAGINQELKKKCRHGLTFEIPRHRREFLDGRRAVMPPIRVCLVCGFDEPGRQTRAGKKLKVSFLKLKAKPVAVVRGHYGAITIGMVSGGRPLRDYVKAALAGQYSNYEELINKIMLPNIYR